jgi:hypothetical protein
LIGLREPTSDPPVHATPAKFFVVVDDDDGEEEEEEVK